MTHKPERKWITFSPSLNVQNVSKEVNKDRDLLEAQTAIQEERGRAKTLWNKKKESMHSRKSTDIAEQDLGQYKFGVEGQMQRALYIK